MKRSRTRCSRSRRPQAPELALALGLLALTPGCVSYQSYDSLSDEVTELREEKERLEEAGEGSDRARVAALEQAEDLREERDRLAGEVRKLSNKVTELEGALRAHESARDAERSRVAAADARFAPVRAELAPEIDAGRVLVVERPEGLRLLVSEELLFAPGANDLSPGGKAVLQRIAFRIRDEDQRVEVEAGAATPPQRLARGAAVMRALASGGVPDEQLRAGSFAAEGDPDADEEPSRPGAEIRLLPNLGAGPGAVSAPAPDPDAAVSPASP